MKKLKWLWYWLIYRKILAITWLVGGTNFLDITITDLGWWIVIMPSILLFTWNDNWNDVKIHTKSEKI